MSGKERKSRHLAEKATITVTAYARSERRVASEKSFHAFCRTFLAHRFPLADSPDQTESKDKIQHAVLTGGKFGQSAPRGDGKTQRALAGVLWAVLSGHRRYVVPVGPTGLHAKKLVQDIAQELADNDELAKDWPEICLSYREVYGKANKAAYLRVRVADKDGQELGTYDPRIVASTNKLVLPTVPGACLDGPQIGGSVIEGAGITGAVRGLRHTTANGETLRPDFALLDDLQTRKSAMSTSQTARIMEILRGDINRLAGPDRELAAICCCTVIRRGDAADQLLDNKLNPQWRGVRKKMVYRWPDAAKLWDEYAKLRKTGLLDGDGGKSANDYYAAHREEMDKGAEVGWQQRYRRDVGEVSAIQCAYNILIDDGEEAFAAECQNEPIEHARVVVEITPAIVKSRLNGLLAGQVPERQHVLTAFCDINRYALSWVVGAWSPDMTGNVVAYGLWPQDGTPVYDEKKPNGQTEEQAVFAALTTLGQHLTQPGLFRKGTEPRKLDALAADCGAGWKGVFEKAVFPFVRGSRLPVVLVPSRGWAAKFFKAAKAIRTGDGWMVRDWGEGKGNVLVHISDHHRLAVHQSLVMPTGSPGGITLYGDKPTAHNIFAEQVCGERLAEHVKGDIADHYLWARTPNTRNDFLDALVGSRVLASYLLNVTGAKVALTPDQPRQTPPAPKQVPKRVGYDAGWSR